MFDCHAEENHIILTRIYGHKWTQFKIKLRGGNHLLKKEISHRQEFSYMLHENNLSTQNFTNVNSNNSSFITHLFHYDLRM